MGGKGAFFGMGSTSIRSTVVTGQTEGLRVGGGMGGWVRVRNGWAEGWADGWAEEWAADGWVSLI